MRIAICDDESIFRESLRTLLKEYQKEKRVPMEITEFENGENLLSSQTAFDMVFLDYQMPGQDGLETARQLRLRNSICSIVFVTSYPQFVFDSFEVQPFRFFVKPLEPQKLTEALDQYLLQQKMLSPLIIVEDGIRMTIKSESILYLEGDGKNCLVRTNDHLFRSSKTLSQVQELLPEHCFYRIHKSYVVNMYCIVSLKNNEISLINGEKALVGRSRITKFKEAYRLFVKNFYVRM